LELPFLLANLLVGMAIRLGQLRLDLSMPEDNMVVTQTDQLLIIRLKMLNPKPIGNMVNPVRLNC